MTQFIVKLGRLHYQRLLSSAVPVVLGTLMAGCAATGNLWETSSPQTEGSIIPSNFDQALEENQRILSDVKGPRDVALYNIGVISAHSANPKKNYPRALLAFSTLTKEYPGTWRAEQAKIWIQALEEKQRNTEVARKLAEEQHALAHERDHLAQEREKLTQERDKLNYAIEKSRQLDAAIEKRRKQSRKR